LFNNSSCFSKLKRLFPSSQIDFLVRSKNNIIPVEVKAKDGRAKSLTEVVESSKYPDVINGIKLANKNIGSNNLYKTFPYFTAFLLRDYLKITNSL
jgi:hypothetical protein